MKNIALGHLCGDLMEEVLDDNSDNLSCDFETFLKKNKAKGKQKRPRLGWSENITRVGKERNLLE